MLEAGYGKLVTRYLCLAFLGQSVKLTPMANRHTTLDSDWTEHTDFYEHGNNIYA